MHILVVQSGSAAGRRVGVEAPVLIGREGADLTIDDPSMSRRHAVVRPAPGGLEVEDVGSRNGTFVNAVQVVAPTLVRPGDILHLGDTSFSVEAAGGAPAAGAFSAGASAPPAATATAPPAAGAPPIGGMGPQYAPPVRPPQQAGRGIKSKPGRSSSPWVVVAIVGIVVLGAAALLWVFAFDDSGKERFIADADAICEDTFGDLQALEGELAAAGDDPAQVQALIDEVVAQLDDTANDIRALDSPEEDRATLGRWLAKVDETIAAGRRLSASVAEGDATGVSVAAQQFESLAAEADQIGAGYGFESCASAASA